MSKKIIAVIGATGAQGGSLVRAIAQKGEYAARAITRKPESDKALELQKLGAEVVAADLDDATSLRKAFSGAHGAFCVTNFWEHFSAEKELEQARNMARAAKDAAVAHVVWSTLEDTRKRVPLSDNRMPTLKDKYKVPHFDAKGEANHFFSDLGVPTTFFHASFYWDNMIHFGMGPKKRPDGKLSFALPMANEKMAGIAAEDIGKCAYGVFARSSELVGKSVGVAGDQLTGAEMAAAMSKAIGQEVVYDYIEPEAYRNLGFPGADDLGNMFQYYRDFASECNALRSVELSRKLNPELQSFAAWLAKNASRIPLG